MLTFGGCVSLKFSSCTSLSLGVVNPYVRWLLVLPFGGCVSLRSVVVSPYVWGL